MNLFSRRFEGYKGFTLLELMVVVGIIGILAAVAMAGYQQYIARSKAADILVQYDELRTRVGTRLAEMNRMVESCDDLLSALKNSHPLRSEIAHLSYGFEASGDGYRPVLQICGATSNENPMATKVAKAAYDILDRSTKIEQGAVLTNSLVSFAARLADNLKPICKNAVSNPVAECKAEPVLVTTAANSPAKAASTQAAPVSCPPGQVPNSSGQCSPSPSEGQAQSASSSSTASTSDQATSSAGAERNCRLVSGEPSTQHVGADGGAFSVDPFSADRSRSSGEVAETGHMGRYGYQEGAQCLVCGDRATGEPCTELDLVLGMTNTCPAVRPNCMNTAVIAEGGVVNEYRTCKSAVDVRAALQNNSGCKDGTYDVAGPVGTECNFACSEDGCNIIDVGAYVGAPPRVVCD